MDKIKAMVTMTPHHLFPNTGLILVLFTGKNIRSGYLYNKKERFFGSAEDMKSVFIDVDESVNVIAVGGNILIDNIPSISHKSFLKYVNAYNSSDTEYFCVELSVNDGRIVINDDDTIDFEIIKQQDSK